MMILLVSIFMFPFHLAKRMEWMATKGPLCSASRRGQRRGVVPHSRCALLAAAAGGIMYFIVFDTTMGTSDFKDTEYRAWEFGIGVHTAQDDNTMLRRSTVECV